MKKNGTGFLVGSAMSLADVGLIEALLSVTEYFGDDTLSDYPSLKVSERFGFRAFISVISRNVSLMSGIMLNLHYVQAISYCHFCCTRKNMHD